MSTQSAIVLKTFIDRNTNEKYEIGSEYVTENPERLSLLQEKGFLHESKELPKENDQSESTEFPKHVGGGYYELSDGSKVKGKEKAYSKQKEG